MKHSLTVKTGMITSSKVVRMAGILVINMILARALSKGDYGTYQQVWLVFSFGFPIFMLGIPASLFYFLHHAESGKRGSVMANSAIILLLSGTVMAVLMGALAGAISRLLGNPGLVLPLRIFSLYALFTVSTLWTEPFYISTDRHLVVLVVSALSTAGLFLAVVPSVLLDKGFVALFAAVGIYSAVRFSGLALMLARDRIIGGKRPDGKLARSQLFYSVPVSGSEIVASVSKSVDKIVISRSFDPSTYAVYSNGAMEIPVSGLLTGAISSVVWPELSRMHGEKRNNDLLSLWFNTTDKTAFLVMPLFFFFLIHASDVMTVLFSEKYLASVLPFRIHLLLLPLRIAQYSVLLLAMGATRTVLYGAAGDLFVKLGLSITLAGPLDYAGPAVAVVCSTWLEVAYYLLVAKRLLRIGVGGILPWKRLLRTCVIAGVACGLSYPLRLLPLPPLLTLALAACVSAFFYFLFFYSFARESMPRVFKRGESN
jgi:O-antigen/teichoic acid export membrane protein